MWVVRGVLGDGNLAPVAFSDLSGDQAVPSAVADACTQLAPGPVHATLTQLIQQDLLGPGMDSANPGADLIQHWSADAAQLFSPAIDQSYLQPTPNGVLELRPPTSNWRLRRGMTTRSSWCPSLPFT
jgi:hypothetical protein